MEVFPFTETLLIDAGKPTVLLELMVMPLPPLVPPVIELFPLIVIPVVLAAPPLLVAFIEIPLPKPEIGPLLLTSIALIVAVWLLLLMEILTFMPLFVPLAAAPPRMEVLPTM